MEKNGPVCMDQSDMRMGTVVAAILKVVVDVEESETQR